MAPAAKTSAYCQLRRPRDAKVVVAALALKSTIMEDVAAATCGGGVWRGGMGVGAGGLGGVDGAGGRGL